MQVAQMDIGAADLFTEKQVMLLLKRDDQAKQEMEAKLEQARQEMEAKVE